MREGSVFAIVDVDESTADNTLYKCMEIQPLKLEEKCPSQCVQVSHSPSFRIRRHLLVGTSVYSPIPLEEDWSVVIPFYAGSQYETNLHY
jgi:hypothetical protein